MPTTYTDILELLQDVRAYTKAGGKVELADQPAQLILGYAAIQGTRSWGIKLIKVRAFLSNIHIPESVVKAIYADLSTAEGRLRLATDHSIEVPAPTTTPSIVFSQPMPTTHTNILELLRDVRAYTKAGGKVEIADQPENLILGWRAKGCACTQCLNLDYDGVCESPFWSIKLTRIKDFALSTKIPEGIARTIYDALRTAEGRLRIVTDHSIEVPSGPTASAPPKTLELTVVSTEKV